MLTNLKDLTLPQISQLPGIHDLPMKVRGPFAQAVKAEANDDLERANDRLEEALKQEAQLNQVA